MALTKSTITGRVPLPTDVAAKAAELIFTLSSWDTQGADVIAPATVRAILGPDASLPAGFALWRNTEGLRGSHYIVTARWTEEDRSRGAVSRETRLGNIQIGDEASYPLAVLLERGIDPAPPSFWVAASAGDVQTIVDAADALSGFTEPGYLAEVQVGAGLANGAATRAEAAADAALGAAGWDQSVPDEAARLALTGLPADWRVYQIAPDPGRIWRWTGTAWADTGENPLAGKASLIDGNLYDASTSIDGQYMDVTTGGIGANATYWLSAPIPVEAGASYAIPTWVRRVWFNAAGARIAGSVEGVEPIIVNAPAGAATLRLNGYKNWGISAAHQYVVRSAAALVEEPLAGRKVTPAQLGGIGGNQIAKWSVGVDRLAAFRPGKNLFDAAKITTGYYDPPQQAPAVNATYCFSDFIPVVAGQQYVASGAGMGRVAYYGPAMEKLRTGVETESTTFTPPAGVHFVRVSLLTALAGSFQLEAGAVATAYQPYRYEARTTTPAGVPIVYPSADPVIIPRPSHFGLERLRETRQRLRSKRMGKTGITARLTIAHIGDSWTNASAQYARTVARALWNKYHPGDANLALGPIGFGFCGFSHLGDVWRVAGSTINNLLALSVSGTWTTTTQVGGPNTGQVSGATGAVLRIDQVIDYSRGLDYKLFAEGGAGAFDHSWDGGATWQPPTDLLALAAGMQVIALSGRPSSGTGSLRIRVTSGPAVLYGLSESHPTAAGVISHKLGMTGSSSYQWSTVDAARWQAGLAALAPDLVTIMFGTNDQLWMTAAQYKTAMETLITRVRTARPNADILLMAPAENQRSGNPISMSAYANALYEIAQAKDVAYLDMQPIFGVNPTDYAAGSARPWFNADLIHPEPDLGGYALADAVLWAIGEGSA